MRKLLFALFVILISSICLGQQRLPVARGKTTTVGKTVLPSIATRQIKDSVYFYASGLPVLGQIAGAPRSFYTYFWELGDGTFSFDETATHIYNDTGNYVVRLFVTNNFDNGKAPVIDPLLVRINRKPASVARTPSYFFNSNINGSIGMKNNREPLPGEDFVTVLGYRNKQVNNLHGKLIIFYNEKEYEQGNFALADKRLYNSEKNSSINALLASFKKGTTKGDRMKVKTGIQQEGAALTYLQAQANMKKKEPSGSSKNLYTSGSPANDMDEKNDDKQLIEVIGADQENQLFDKDLYIPPTNKKGISHDRLSMLQSLKKTFNNNTVFRFDSLARGEEKFIFITMNASAKMVQDTDATLTLTALMIPDDPLLQPEKYELQMQVVASHDPNRFMLRNNRIRYRFFSKRKELTYQVRFENTGKGPARNVGIAIALPKQLNPASLQIKKISPACQWCYTASGNQSCIDTFRIGDSMHVTFKNIYIPGMQQRSVRDKDSARGFFEYSIRFQKKPRKIPFGNSAKITFDKNEAIYTNKAMARFKRGISPGIIAGYNFSLSSGDYSGKGPIQIGYTVAPYSPYRPYFQLEVFAAILQQEDSTASITYSDPAPFRNNQKYRLVSQDIKKTTKSNSLNLVPLHFRYNLNDWMGVGLGAMAQLILTEQQSRKDTYFLRNNPNNRYDSVLVEKTVLQNNGRQFLANSNIAAFADLQVGRVRTGPSIGLRYLRQIKGNVRNQFFVYAAIRL